MHVLGIMLLGVLLTGLAYWHSHEYRWITKELGTRKQLSERISRTRDPHTRHQLARVEYSMAKAQLRHGSTGSPRTYLPRHDPRAWYDNASPFVMGIAVSVIVLFELSAVRLSLSAARGDDPTFVLVSAFMALLGALLAAIILIQYNSRDAALRRRIYALSNQDAETRWQQLLILALEESASTEGMSHS